MALHPDLLAFRERLDECGIVAAEHADHVCVRLPLLASVRVRYDGTRLSLEPRFGAAPRTAATVGALGSTTALLVGLTISGAALPVLATGGALCILASAYDVMRYAVTEAAITRVTMLWQGRGAPRPAATLGPAAMTPLDARAAREADRAPRG